MPRPTLEFQPPAGPWLHPADAANGVSDMVLSWDTGMNDATLLQRYDAGVDTSAHGVIRHTYWEEVYILSGTLVDVTLDRTFTAGDYASRPPGMPHGPYRTPDGVLMLVVRRPVNA